MATVMDGVAGLLLEKLPYFVSETTSEHLAGTALVRELKKNLARIQLVASR